MANPDKTDVIDQTKRTRSERNASCGDATNSPVANFEQSLDELETLVQRMETGDLALEDSLTAYERGIALYRQCRGALDDAELRVKLLSDPLDPENADDFKPDAS
ncbi:MAG: exodeoxyribonuclease VII small subunit [Gammaproteobacteria bacterium HGW-Gammaproteobacteria-6]|nr:MAG: exodeoxyribonuclease VII small subunit [Gammaproteobacteria bacterium HGW-Gammaproteobacteria-6]